MQALALQFSQGRSKNSAHQQQDVASLIGSGGGSVLSGVSSGSAERRKMANEWVEDSKCMYGAGGIVSSWGGL